MHGSFFGAGAPGVKPSRAGTTPPVAPAPRFTHAKVTARHRTRSDRRPNRGGLLQFGGAASSYTRSILVPNHAERIARVGRLLHGVECTLGQRRRVTDLGAVFERDPDRWAAGARFAVENDQARVVLRARPEIERERFVRLVEG